MSAAANRTLVDWGVVTVFEDLRANATRVKIMRVRRWENSHFCYPVSSSHRFTATLLKSTEGEIVGSWWFWHNQRGSA